MASARTRIDHVWSVQIIGPLGAGGMGEVYRARDPRLQRNVALKILRKADGHDPTRQPRLLREARAASALNHPNIIVVFDVGVEHDVPFIVSELIDGDIAAGRPVAGTAADRICSTSPCRLLTV